MQQNSFIVKFSIALGICLVCYVWYANFLIVYTFSSITTIVKGGKEKGKTRMRRGKERGVNKEVAKWV